MFILPDKYKNSPAHFIVHELFLYHHTAITDALKKGPLEWATLKFIAGSSQVSESFDEWNYCYQGNGTLLVTVGKTQTKYGPGGILKIAKEILNNQTTTTMNKQAAPIEELQMEVLQLKDISLSPTNPRKHFDDESIKELSDSIREQGVIEPIVVRPKGKSDKWELVCGERRYRACQIVAKEFPERSGIPAVIRNLTNDEALEVQIVENLQRKNVHPMDEAVAFKAWIDAGKFSIQMIAQKIGKAPRFVAERIKLADLSEGFQKIFFAGRISLADAFKVCKLSADSQKALQKELDFGDGPIEISNWVFKKYQGELLKAPFNIQDPELNKKMGPCTSCSYNSATNVLFPEEAANPKCTNLACFRIKADNSYRSQLKIAMEDPAIILVSDEYGSGQKSSELTKKGNTVYTRGSYSEEQKPIPPDSWEEFKSENLDDFQSEKDCKKAYDGEVEDYNRDLEEYNKKVSSGKFLKAFVVEGDDAGQYYYVQLKKDSKQKGTAAALKAKEETGKVTAADLESEMARIREAEKRKKELDGEKINAQLYEFFKKDKTYTTRIQPLEEEEKIALIICMADAAGWNYSKEAEKILGVSDDGRKIKMFKRLQTGKVDELLNRIARLMLVERLYASNTDSDRDGKAAALEALMIEHHNKEANEIIDLQEEEAKARAIRVNARLEEVKKKLKDLKATAPAGKKTAPAGKKKGLSALLDKQAK